MYLYACALLLGVLLFQQLTSLFEAHWVWLFLVCIPGFFLTKIFRLLATVSLGFFWAFFWAHSILSTALPADFEGRDVWLTGTLISLTTPLEHGIRFEMKVDSIAFEQQQLNTTLRVRLSSYRNDTLNTLLRPGERWRVMARLKRPHGLQNPGGFDYERWLFQQHIRATGYIKAHVDNQRLETAPFWSLSHLRDTLRTQLQSALPTSEFVGIITALAVGDRSLISREQWRVLTDTGINHLVAISGLHIGLVAGMVFFCVRFVWSRLGNLALRLPAPKAAALVSIGVAALYAALAGFSIPTQRAFVMVLVFFSSLLLNKKFTGQQLLSLALIAVLLIDPHSVMSMGFWLSFVAVAIIFYGVSGRLRLTNGWQWVRVQWMIALGLMPFILVFYTQVSMLSPIANMMAVPWVSFIVVPLTLVGLFLLQFLPSLASFILTIASDSLWLLWFPMSYIADFDRALWQQHRPVGWSLVLGMVGVLWLLAPKGVPNRWLGVCWLLPMFLVKPKALDDEALTFTLLDVGQGLSAVVQTKNHVLVFDTGQRYSSRFDIGESVIVPYLRQTGWSSIDTLIISHGDADHIGGLEGVTTNIPVQQILTSVPEKVANDQVMLCQKGQAWIWDSVHFEILHPQMVSKRKNNNDSCVLKVTAAGISFLLTGDIEKSAEKQLLQHSAFDMQAAVLVAPHHGSNTSSTTDFIRVVSPEFGLFPVGYRNRFGFPKARVVTRYQQQQVMLYDTASHGAITFSVDTQGLQGPYLHRQMTQGYWQSEK